MSPDYVTTWSTLLTAHKGVDLHAATALTVMRDRLEGGDDLQALRRCEWHACDTARVTGGVAPLLDVGRYFNPNKHHYGIFHLESADPWSGLAEGRLADGWPGICVDADLEKDSGPLAGLLGEAPEEGLVAVDILSRARGQSGPVVSGVLWRLVLTGDAGSAAVRAVKLAVARRRKEGLLVNPHLEEWLVGPVCSATGREECA